MNIKFVGFKRIARRDRSFRIVSIVRIDDDLLRGKKKKWLKL